MKKTTLLSLLTMFLFFLGNNVWADDEPFYTLWTVSAEGTNHTNYTQYFDDEHDGMVWNAPGNQKVSNDITDRWRIGGKNLDNVDRTITAKTPMGSAIDRVVLNHFGVSRASVIVNSLTLTVAADVEYATILDEVVLTPAIGQGEAGSVEFLPTASFGTEWPTEAYYRLTINLSNPTGSNGGLDLASIQFFAPTGAVNVAKPVITPNGGVFSEAQEVTITSEGNTIYYTTDGTDPTDASTLYTAPFFIGTNTTLKAIAYDEDDNKSGIVTAEFKFLTPITSIAELCAAATDTEEPVLVEFNGWICTGVKGSNAYFTDGVKGIQVYQSGHGFELGDMLKGSAQVKLKLYNECAEVMGLTATTEGVIVEKGAEATPQVVDVVSDLTKDMQGCLIYMEGVTYSGGVFVDDDDNTIKPYGTFIQLPELIEGKIYNVTGVAIWWSVKDGNGYWEIAPRTADEFVLVTSQFTPISSWSVESESVDINGTPTAKFTTNSDGVVTYTSSNEDVATINEAGVITPVGRGTTTITAKVAETETFLPDSKSFTLTVTVEGYVDVIFAYDDADIQGQGAPDTGAELTVTRDDVLTLFANKAYAKVGETHIKFYGSKYEEVGEGEEKEKVLTEPSYIQLSVPEACVITDIVLTATSETYIQEWTDQFGASAVIDGATATWTGRQTEVVLTNQASKQARIKSIAVTYFIVDPDGIEEVSAQWPTANGQSIYNLAGQRMSRMQKGINIVGGKKVLR